VQPSKNTEKLRQIMQRHALTSHQVAEILNRSCQTVRIWRCVNTQDIPDSLLELLELKLTQSREEVAA